MGDKTIQGQTETSKLSRRLATSLVALLATLSVGCAGRMAIDSHIDPNGPEGSQEAMEEVAEPQEPAEFARECTDGRGEPTGYAVMELEGKDLSILLSQQGYTWSERERMWLKENGSAALMALDAEGEQLGYDAMDGLGRGFKETGVCYKIVTSGYRNARKAFDELAGVVLTKVDVEADDTNAIGVVKGAKGERCLVLATKSNDVHIVYVLSEGAVKAGLFDKVCGKELGSTIESAFKAVSGRELAVADKKE